MRLPSGAILGSCRDVAIKVLPESVANDPEALARLEREARAVAALSHPNIRGIFELARQDELVFAVMELLEGESLRVKLLAGALPQTLALDYALQAERGPHDGGGHARRAGVCARSRRAPALVRHCLEKRPEDRFQAAKDLAYALAQVASGASASAPVAASPRRRPSSPARRSRSRSGSS